MPSSGTRTRSALVSLTRLEASVVMLQAKQRGRAEGPASLPARVQSFAQPHRVPRREALPVVVEVSVDVAGPALQPLRPLLELALAVVAALPSRTGVEA